MKIFRFIIVLAGMLITCGIDASYSQAIPDSTVKKIDSIFLKWDNPNIPGCAVGIIRNDSIIYLKGFGSANLEYGIPITPETVFHVASVSKQFTAWSIILLARQNKLSLGDDVRKYLPWFPDLNEKITIQQLLNHTSGIRDQWQLLAISGTRLDDVITQEQIVKILSNQKELNFKPGEKHSYSNSGYTMLAEIVKAVTGQSLRKFTDSAIFKPLGMHHTHFHDDYMEIERNRAYSYNRKDSAHFTNSVLSYSNAGATSLFTTVNDMAKWVMNFYAPKVGDQQDILALTTKGKLNSGKEISYANGIVVGKTKGWTDYSHGGADAGYRSQLSVFPDKKMGFVVLGNLGDIDAGGKVYNMADIFLKDTTSIKKETKKQKRDSTTAILKDTVSIKKYLGHYISEEGLPIRFDLQKRRLNFHVYDQHDFLIKDSTDRFSIPSQPGIIFKFSVNNKDTIVDITTPDEVYHLVKYKYDTMHTDDFLSAYTGIYYSGELNCRYGIILKDHQLYLTSPKYNDTKLIVVNSDHLTNDYWWINQLKMLRDDNNKVNGFEINSGRVMHVKFKKIE